MSKRDDIKKQLEEDQDRFYGDQTVSGHSPDTESDDSIEEMVGDVMGEDAARKVESKKEGFNIADEIEGDELAQTTKPVSSTSDDNNTSTGDDYDDDNNKIIVPGETSNDPREK